MLAEVRHHDELRLEHDYIVEDFDDAAALLEFLKQNPRRGLGEAFPQSMSCRLYIGDATDPCSDPPDTMYRCSSFPQIKTSAPGFPSK